MEMRLIRHATLALEIQGKRILVDPMLSPAGEISPVPNSPNQRRNPLVPLPMPLEEVLDGLDALIVTHTHWDHLDDAAVAALPKGLPLLCQPCDSDRLSEKGFTDVRPVSDSAAFAGIEVVRTGGQHGTGVIGQMMGTVSGFLLRPPGEPTLYVAGDTIWCSCVRRALKEYRPDVVVLNAGAAQFNVGDPITMTAEDVEQVCHTLPRAQAVAVHMEAVNHCLLTRETLREAVRAKGLSHQVIIPADGDGLTFGG